MNKIYIDIKKLKNNHDYEDLIKEINSYKDSNYIPKDKEVWEYRKKLFDGATTVDKGDIKAVIIPNNTYIPNRKDRNKPNYGVSYNDYTIHFFYKGVSIGIYSKYLDVLDFDNKLEDSNILEQNMNTILELIPFDIFNVKYNLYYTDWNNRPFYY